MENAIEKFHINLEEARNKITFHAKSNFETEPSLHECQQALSVVYHDVQNLFDTMHIPTNSGGISGSNINGDGTSNSNDVWFAMIENCKLKASQLAKDLCFYVTSTSTSLPSYHDDDSVNANDIDIANNDGKIIYTTLIDQHGISSQTAIAQIVELTIRLIIECTPILDDISSNSNNNNNSNDQASIDIQETLHRYTAYQRSLLRNRSKPSIENIAQIRNYAKQSHLFVSDYIYQTTNNDDGSGGNHQQHHHNDSSNEIMDQEEYERYCKQPYAHAITVILGESSSLLHPLMMWLDGISTQLDNLHNQHNQHSHENKEQKVQSSLMEMCVNTINTVHLEAQSLSVTIGNWFIQDHQESFNATTTTATHTEKNQYQHQHHDNGNSHHNGHGNYDQHHNERHLNLTILDNTLDEMAYVCQVIHRYCGFSNHIAQHIEQEQEAAKKNNSDNKNEHEHEKTIITLNQHLQEQSLFYSTTETKLTNANLKQAFKIAKPVEMILGMEIYVPSIVDDAYFISTRALERASGTLEHRAVWTIAHWVVDVWNVDTSSDTANSNQNNNSIYHALLTNIGCTVNEEEMKIEKSNEQGNSSNHNKKNDDNEERGSTAKKKSKKGFSFSSVIIDVLDKNTTSGNMSRNNDKSDGDAKKKAPLSGPLSGSLLNRNSVDTHKVQIDTQFCTLNGIHAASSACIGLAELFDTLISVDDDDNDDDNEKEPVDEQTTAMIKLAKEQMESHSRSYKHLLREQIQHIVTEWCGAVTDTTVSPPLIASLPRSPCLHRIYFYMSNEEYNLSSADFYKAETDERLEKLLIKPIYDSRLLTQVRNGKCDEGVTIAMMQELSCQVVSLIFNTLLNQKKQFSDWGSLLLSKQIRLLERFFCSIVLHDDNDPSLEVGTVGGNTNQILSQFQKIKQAVTILQLDKPSDWSAFAYEVGDSVEFNLNQDEIRSVMKLRGDWSLDLITAVCGPKGSN